MEYIIKLPASTKLLLLMCTAILLTACGSEDPVSSFNANPVATVDTAVTDEDNSVTTTDVRLNDTDTDGDILTVITGNPAAFSGTVINNNNVTSTLANAIGYFKASNTEADDNFGTTVSLSDDGSTLAIGASLEDSNTTGINTTANELAADSGAVYIFTNNANIWTQQAYIKAHNTDAGDKFGSIVSLSSNGNTLAAGALNEDSDSTGINGVQNNSFQASDSGAAYVFTRDISNIWSVHQFQ